MGKKSDKEFLKSIAGRPKDLEDIRGIITANPNLDESRIKQWLSQFAEILNRPDMWRRIEKILKD